jgi:hypothetical protein
VATFIRRRDEHVAQIRCDDCSQFDHDGFPLPAPEDDARPDAVRCWVPVAGGACTACGRPA